MNFHSKISLHLACPCSQCNEDSHRSMQSRGQHLRCSYIMSGATHTVTKHRRQSSLKDMMGSLPLTICCMQGGLLLSVWYTLSTVICYHSQSWWSCKLSAGPIVWYVAQGHAHCANLWHCWSWVLVLGVCSACSCGLPKLSHACSGSGFVCVFLSGFDL